MIEQILELTPALMYQLTPIIIGYMGFWVAYHGIKIEDKIDTIFKIAIFSLPSLVVFYYASHLWLIVSTIATLIIAMSWRKYGRNQLYKTLSSKYINISTEDMHETAIKSVLYNTSVAYSWVFVYTKEGKRIGSCLNRDSKLFNSFKLNTDGIFLYKDYIEDEAIGDDDYRYNTLTYIPFSNILRIELVTDEDFSNLKQ